MHRCDLILDFQWGSTGKGLLAGYLAKRKAYDTVICAFAPNAGHTYIDKARGIQMMTQQLPTGISSPTVKNVLIGPGALINIDTLYAEMERYAAMLDGKRVIVHPHAAIVHGGHCETEKMMGMSKIGSTVKGVGAAMIERIRRDPDMNNAAIHWKSSFNHHNIEVDADAYRHCLEESEACLVEGAQGFSLSMYHGQYPYTTSRDVTPWQVAADCGLPFKWASYINIMGTLRTFPIRVNNRDGSSGPCYPDQTELAWGDLGIVPELTTVTKLPRRIFTFSDRQLLEAFWHCGQYYETHLFLNFANYLEDGDDVAELIARIEQCEVMKLNPPKVQWLGYGPDDADVEIVS
jgi:adenylosuccinate synthase